MRNECKDHMTESTNRNDALRAPPRFMPNDPKDLG